MTDGVSFENLNAAEQVAKRIGANFTNIGPDLEEILFYHRIRVKSPNSIREKLYRKRFLEGKTGYNYKSISDIVGVRIVVLHDDHLIRAFDLLCDVIKLSQVGDQPIFHKEDKWIDLVEAQIYHRRNPDDFGIDVYKELQSHILERVENESPSGTKRSAAAFKRIVSRINFESAAAEQYSSAHFVFSCRSYDKGRITSVPLEFQIRTAAEDIWAEINHKLLYKSKSPYIWTPNLERAYAELNSDSIDFKSRIEDLSNIIHRFSDHSGDVLRQQREFQNPRTRLHGSLVFSLYFAMSGRLTEDNSGLFPEYDKIVSRLQETYKSSEFDKVAAEAISVLDRMEEEQNSFLESPDITASDAVLCEQRKHLICFEKVRLKVLIELSNISIVEGSGKSKKAIENVITRRSPRLSECFDDLCNIKNNGRVLVRPVSAMSYWKYLCQRYLNRDRALSYIRVAKEELKYDTALPSWSIYRVLIPRQLSRELISSVTAAIGPTMAAIQNGDTASEAKVNISTLYTVDQVLVEAFDAAMESYFELIKSDKRRGDLIFSQNEGVKFGDEELIFFIVLIYAKLFSRSILDQGDGFAEQYRTVTAAVRRKLNKAQKNGQSYETVSVRLADAQRALKALSDGARRKR